jgi:hypothetical protein
LQEVPSVTLGFEHVPFAESHAPAAWHWSSAEHATRLDPTHTPPWHVSVCVHASPSSQAVPSVALGFEHVPFAESHVPAVWHWSSALQTMGYIPVHTPLWHASICVHASPSSQSVPSFATGFEHAPVLGSQEPAT